jgi:hypothetical protein
MNSLCFWKVLTNLIYRDSERANAPECSRRRHFPNFSPLAVAHNSRPLTALRYLSPILIFFKETCLIMRIWFLPSSLLLFQVLAPSVNTFLFALPGPRREEETLVKRSVCLSSVTMSWVTCTVHYISKHWRPFRIPCTSSVISSHLSVHYRKAL